MKCVEPFETGNRNEIGERLLDFAVENNLVIRNSSFQKATHRYWTWEATGDVTKNQIDYMMSSDRKIVGNCEVKTKVDISSDHRISIERVKNKTKQNKTKKKKKKNPTPPKSNNPKTKQKPKTKQNKSKNKQTNTKKPNKTNNKTKQNHKQNKSNNTCTHKTRNY